MKSQIAEETDLTIVPEVEAGVIGPLGGQGPVLEEDTPASTERRPV
jgi:hypothetical protein